MKKLNRMLLREIRASKAQFIAAVAVVVLGIAMFTAAFISYRNLKNSKDYYYERYNFLDYYAAAADIDSQAVSRINALDGVREAQGRIALEAGADMEEINRVTIRLLSLPDGNRPAVNDVSIVSGSYLDLEERACLVSRSFAQFYKLEPGSKLKILLNNKRYDLLVEGIAESPEYIYEIKSAASAVPSPEEFGLVYVKESELREMAGTKGMYNEVHVTFDHGIDETKVIKSIEYMLKNYGFIGGVSRKDQISNTMVSNEIEEMKGVAAAFPVLFLSVAAMMIYIMLRRIISNQRTLIGIMKALGYKNRSILWHYILYALLIGFLGSVLGTTLGMGLGVIVTAMYNRIFNIPVMDIKLYPDLFLLGAFLSLGFCLAAGYGSAKRVLKIAPAEAMRSEAPKTGKRVVLEKIKFIWNKVSFGTKISIRNVFRNKKRALLTAFSTSLTMMFIMVAMSFMDSIDYLLKQHFTVFQKQDYKLLYSSPESIEVLNKLNNVEGILKSEPLMELPLELGKNEKSEKALIVGVSKDISLYSIFDKDKSSVPVPAEGILVSERLAEKLSLQAGDTVTVSVYGRETVRKDMKVAAVIRQYAGANCYMNLVELQGLTGFDSKLNGALLKIDPNKENEIRKEILKDNNVSTMESRQKSHNNFIQLMEFMYIFFIVMIAFGSVMGFSIVFNTTVINIMERKRELASLKVLGYSRKEIEKTVFKENIILGVFALIPGLIIGRIMCSIFAKQYSNDFFTFEVFIKPQTYVIAALSMFLFIILAQYSNRKNIVGLDMIAVLKDREE